jgi:alpha-N-arabinofuranosidase
MYNVHQDATLLPLQLTSTEYQMGSGKLKSVSASASVNAEGVMHITLVNINSKDSQSVSINIQNNKTPLKAITGRILNSDRLQDHNRFENPTKVTPKNFNGAALGANGIAVTLPPFSVVMLELK